ncbi:hypothetical protein ACO1PF_07960 [Alkalibacterium sp. f15]|uniref:hypothetical protein n=1 Tax=Alkalibacterium sp. f15 TaxID=3414029 RepID=UPI003BF78764
MNKKWVKISSVALMSLYLAACDTTEEEVVEEDTLEIVEAEEALVVEDDSDEDTELDGDTDHHDEDEAQGGHDHDEDDEEHSVSEADVEESIEIEGMAHHYHTGQLVELTAIPEDDGEYDDWHWYMRADEESEWEMFSGQNSNEFFIEAPEDSVEIRVVLYDNEHKAHAESVPVELEVDNH